MATSEAQQEGFTMPELEYLAQCEDVTIVPLHRMERLELVRGAVGPFRPPQKTQVPLWLAVMLKRANRCRIVAPAWLGADHLRALCREEDAPDALFTRLPPHYLEIAHALLAVAEDDLADAQAVRRLLQDLRETRQTKTREGLKLLNSLQLQMDNLSAAEINEIRPLFGRSFDMLRRLDALAATAADRAHRGSQLGPADDSQYADDADDDDFAYAR
ncbi:DNA replication protein psf2 [Coemansia javaensis]|uniref:DNA replication complex GINS protein PSF2 n=1 Tax=Coemansia javaensis TaxID=2761396 RepID=A0A9W8HH06_9FUNG|nr:DNA replication protein psf2 [Coemansia javaensis]